MVFYTTTRSSQVDLTTTQEVDAQPLTGNELTRIVQNGFNAKVTLQQIAALAPSPYAAQNIVSATGPFTLAATNYGDVIVTTTAAVTVQLPDSTLRGGHPVRVSDRSGTPAVTIQTTSGQTYAGMTSFALSTPYGGFTLWPLSTGGWYSAG
jgi:hypothetical protein